jgi:hypothetical protein
MNRVESIVLRWTIAAVLTMVYVQVLIEMYRPFFGSP